MRKKLIKAFMLFTYFLTCSACTAEDVEYAGMASAEREFNRMVIADLSVETEFPDPEVLGLARAAIDGRLQDLEKAYKQGVDINTIGVRGTTVLFWSMRNINGFSKLLEFGADPNITFMDSSVMHWIVHHSDPAFLRFALQYKGNPNLIAGINSETPIFRTITISGDYQQHRDLLLKAGADINARNKEEQFGISMGGKTPLMVAADLARFDIVYELLEKGADYSLRDENNLGLLERMENMKKGMDQNSAAWVWLNKVSMWIDKERKIKQ